MFDEAKNALKEDDDSPKNEDDGPPKNESGTKIVQLDCLSEDEILEEQQPHR